MTVTGPAPDREPGQMTREKAPKRPATAFSTVDQPHAMGAMFRRQLGAILEQQQYAECVYPSKLILYLTLHLENNLYLNKMAED